MPRPLLPQTASRLALTRLLTVLALVLACPLGCTEVQNDEERAMDLSRTVMSPFCPGRTLDTCPSPAATEWRTDIRKWVDEGVSSDEIRRRLYARAPNEDLSGGPSTGLGMWFPVAMALGAVALLVLIFKRLSLAKQGALAAAEASAKEMAQADDAQLEERLQRELEQND